MGEERSRGDLRRRASVWLASTLAGCLSASAFAFDYFEHRYLGTIAYKKALEKVADPAISDALQRITQNRFGFGSKVPDPSDHADMLRNELPFQFGDLSALAGDFTQDLNDLRTLSAAMVGRSSRHGARDLIIDTRRQWFSACKWFYQRGSPPKPGGLAKPDPAAPRTPLPGTELPKWENCFDLTGPGSLDKPAIHMFGSSGYQASREELASHEKIPKYISLASQNKKHFPRHSWAAYGRNHAEALRLAGCYARRTRCAGVEAAGEELLAEALLSEAFAQHYLHDSFAAGHVGARYGQCLFDTQVFCTPTKRRLQHAHDSLNGLGFEVALPKPPDYFDEVLKGKLQRGWTVFGDDHLFIEEAEFHRAVVIRTATESLAEVVERARRAEGGSPDLSCRMCTTDVFPIPSNPTYLSWDAEDASDKTDLAAADYPTGDLVRFDSTGERPLDPRVPGIQVEGWKLGFGAARQSLGGDLLKGPLETGAMFRLDYLRNGDPAWPSAYGFELWGFPNFRTSYLLTAGYTLTPDAFPFSVVARAKFGWRIEDTFTRDNPTPQRIGGVEIVFPAIDIIYEIYPPVSYFLTFNLFTWFYRQGTTVHEFINHDQYSSVLIGFRFDLSGI